MVLVLDGNLGVAREEVVGRGADKESENVGACA